MPDYNEADLGSLNHCQYSFCCCVQNGVVLYVLIRTKRSSNLSAAGWNVDIHNATVRAFGAIVRQTTKC